MKTDRTSSWSLVLAASVLVACAALPAAAAFPRAVAATPPVAAGKTEKADKTDTAKDPSGERDRGGGAASEAKDVEVEHGQVTVAKGEKVADLVVTFGGARVEGAVTGDVVVTFGNVEMDGEVHGNLVVVLGGAKVSGMVHGDAVAVGGTLTLDEGAHVKGDAMALGGSVRRAEGARVDGQVVSKGYEAIPESLRGRARLFFEECVLLARPLSLRVDFVWWLWGGLQAIAAMLALLFPGAVQAVMGTLRERPVASVFAGLASMPLAFLVGVTLSVTVVLAPAVLLLVAAMCVGTALGEASFMRLLGAALLRPFRPTPLGGGVEFVLGAALLTGLMLVPFLGLMVWAAVDLWVFGAVMLTLAGGRKQLVVPPVAAPDGPSASSPQGFVSKSAPMTGAPVSSSAETPAVPTAPVMAADTGLALNAPPSPFENVATLPSASPGTESPIMTTPHDVAALPGAAPCATSAPPPPSRRWRDADPGAALDARGLAEAQYPTVGRRLGALLVDWLPLLMIGEQIPKDWPALVGWSGVIAYFAAMLAWRGTTLGGMVAGLRVVRVDGRPMDRPTAVVRALAAILSGLSGGLGWLWGSWDSRRQTWHDRIAGTVVVRDDTGRSLV